MVEYEQSNRASQAINFALYDEREPGHLNDSHDSDGNEQKDLIGEHLLKSDQ